MIELTLQRVVESSTLLIQATSLTYWLSQFAVVGIALTWVYFNAHGLSLHVEQDGDPAERRNHAGAPDGGRR